MERLNDILRELGISKVKLAKCLGVSRQMIYNYLELDDINKWPKDKKVILLNILGIKSADELDNIKVDTDYIMDVETRINSLFENSNKSELGESNVIFSGLDEKRKELLHNIVDEVKERLEDEKDEEGYNSILYLYHYLQSMEGMRELKYILAEDGYLLALQMMHKYNMLRFYSDKIKYNEELINKFKRAENLLNWYKIQFEEDIEVWRMRFNILFFALRGENYISLINGFELTSKEDTVLKNDHKYMEYAVSLFKRYKEHKPSFIYGVCSALSTESAVALAAVMGENKQDIIKDYLTKYKHVKIDLSGNDLIDLGIPKGPEIKKSLDKLLKAKLDGIVNNKNDEILFIKKEYGV